MIWAVCSVHSSHPGGRDSYTRRAIWTLFWAPVLVRMRDTWVLTVASPMKRVARVARGYEVIRRIDGWSAAR